MTNQFPKISVIMAAHNEGNFLENSIESILNQSFSDFEIIIVDDCSTDSTPNILNKFQNDKRIIILKNTSNLGASISRNKALQKAKGKYIAIMDADDVSLPERLQKQYDFLEANPDIFLVGSGAQYINEKGEKMNTIRVPYNKKEISVLLPKKNVFIHSSILFHNTGKYFYREKFFYSQDYELFLRLLSDGKKMVNIPDILIQYRIKENSISFSKRSEQFLLAEKAREFYWQRKNTGKDEYESFDPVAYLKERMNDPLNPHVLVEEIKAHFKKNDFLTTRELIRKYFSTFGYYNIYLIYYVISFFPRNIVNSIRRILWR
jgi:glycosyltransferase involved in cell wall biosynthesis